MSNKIMDVRSCIDAAVSPEGLKTSGGGGGEPGLWDIVIDGISGKTTMFQGSQSAVIRLDDVASAEAIIVMSINAAIKAISDITGTAEEWVNIARLSPMFPSGAIQGVYFTVNGTNGQNYVGRIDNWYIQLLHNGTTIPTDTVLIVDTTICSEFAY